MAMLLMSGEHGGRGIGRIFSMAPAHQGESDLWPDKNITYEVLVGQDKRWIIDSTYRTKPEAMTRAQALLETNQHDAVRVTREENNSGEEIVFQKECAKKAEKPITISPIDKAAVCSGMDDFCAFEARKTVGRLLRHYLDEQAITALELLHDHRHIRQLTLRETLSNQAVHRIASIQARALGEDSKARNDLLYKLVRQFTERARDTEDTGKYLAILKNKGLAAALDGIRQAFAPRIRVFFTGAVLAAYVGQSREWKNKLLLVIELLDKKTDAEALAHIDEICAEIVDGAEAVKDLLGPQPDLISALRVIAQLSAGRYRSGKPDATLLDRFNAVMARHRMPATQGVLLERVERAVSGTQPLTRESDETDKTAFTSLLENLIDFGGLVGGGRVSEAVTRRARMVLKTGDDDLSPEEGIASILKLLPNRAVKIGYLLDLSQSEFGAKHRMDVLKSLLAIVEKISSMTGLLPEGSSRQDFVRAVNDLRQRLGSGALGEEVGALISKKLDRLIGDKGRQGKKSFETPVKKAAERGKPTAKTIDQRVCRAGNVIFQEGDPGDEAFFITSGEVEISLKSGDRDIIIATVGRGDIIGEMALIDDQPRMATAKALTDTTLSIIPQEAFKKRLGRLAEEDRVIHRLLEIFVDRLRNQARNL